MATAFCQKCKQVHPGRECDHDENGDCAETLEVDQVAETENEESKDD